MRTRVLSASLCGVSFAPSHSDAQGGANGAHSGGAITSATLEDLRFDDKGLIPAIAQSRHTGEVRMLAFANREAIEATLRTGRGHFFSRSRQCLWRKGESSGHELVVHAVLSDCDCDAVLYMVDPSGATCHTGRPSCFFRNLSADAPQQPVASAAGSSAINAPGEALDNATALPTLFALAARLEERRDSTQERSYTRQLLAGGATKLAEKILEESQEFSEALVSESPQRALAEAADVLYHLWVALMTRGLTPEELAALLSRRFGESGLEEKARRRSSAAAPSH